MIAGHIQVIVAPSALPHRSSGRVKVLAVTSGGRMEPYLDIPTSKESGGPEMEMVGWFAVVGPARIPKELVEKLEAASRAALSNPAARIRTSFPVGSDNASVLRTQ